MSYRDALNLQYGSTAADASKAYVQMARTLHPDAGGDPVRWTLITAAYNAIKQDRLYGKAEMLWQRDWDQINGVKHEAPKTETPKSAKSGACGHPTKSGPCCRPAGHSNNGHMSEAVKDKKYANWKARQGR
jgi:hypothetical protein